MIGLWIFPISLGSSSLVVEGLMLSKALMSLKTIDTNNNARENVAKPALKGFEDSVRRRIIIHSYLKTHWCWL